MTPDAEALLPTVAVLVAAEAAMSPLDIVRAAAGLARVVFIIDASEVQREPMLERLTRALAPTRVVNVSDTRAALAALDQLGAGVVLTFSDAYCGAVDRLRTALSGADDVCPGRWGKDIQRRRLLDAGLSSAEHRLIRTGPDLHAASDALGWPVVVKPIVGVASRDIWLLHGPDEVAAVLSEMERSGTPPSSFVAERFVAGLTPPHVRQRADYVSVELFVGPQRTAALITDRPRLAPPCRETGIIGPTALDHDLQEHLLRVALAAHKALGLTTGAFHVELKIDDVGAEVIEVNGRLGGYVRRLVELGTGVDLGRTALACHLGVDPSFDQTWRHHVLGLLFQPPREARIVAASPRRVQIADLPGVVGVDHVAATGSAVCWRVGSGGAAAKLWLVADTAAELEDRTSAVVRALDGLFEFHDGHGRRVRDAEWLGQMS
ncbi:ATP-grasp domain-containing protein [Krasilnikovia sp. MM14-A1259]|uniref:ATP-grasp domain-containing protein n=1 Tax=Krasilnikovia sp. MM14-A1259 TaxID=3373539 RepID=UPI0038088DD9